MHRKPLSAAEFLGQLSKTDPVYQEEEQTYKVRISDSLNNVL